MIEFGHELKNMKTAIAEIRSYRNEIETKLETNKVELCSRLAALAESNKEKSNEINELKKQLHEAEELTSDISPIIGIVVGATQLILDGYENNNEGSSLMNVKKSLKIAKLHLDQRNIKTIIKAHYWTDAEQSGKTPNS